MPLRYNAHASSGNIDTLVAGSVVGGTAVRMNDTSRPKVKNLSALVTVDAETTSLTFTGKWQVSNDNTTWVDVCNGPQNAAGVVLATGTAGADAAVTRAYEAPPTVYGWQYARFALVTAGATGNAVDTYAISYSYRTDR
jgi:hypothetical protein